MHAKAARAIMPSFCESMDFNSASKEMQFASAVASFGMVLRQSEHRGTSNLAAVEEIATGAAGKDDGGYRSEFVDLVKRAATMGIK